MEERGLRRVASSCIDVIACLCICICMLVYLFLHVGAFLFAYLCFLLLMWRDHIRYMLSCREEGGYSSEAIAVFVCVFALFESACVVVRKKTGKRGRCGVGGGGGGHSGSGN